MLTLAEAVRIAWQRGRIMQDATGNGAMASVGLTGEEAADVVAPHGERVVVAAFNAPRSVVLSGEPEALTGILAGLDARGVNHRRLPVHYAFHSPQMEPLRHRLVAALGKVEAGAPEVPFYSTVTGGLVTGPVFDAPYFGRNMREPVRLAPAVEAMAGEVDLILEIGPHPVLAAAMAETLAGRHDTVRILATLRRQRPERQSLLQMCGGLYAAGADLSWDQIVGAPEQPVSLPAYPWRRRRYWIRQRPAEVGAGRATNHPLLGVRLSLAAGITVFEGHASADWIHDHVIMGETLLPAAAMMELLSAAAREATGEPLALEAEASIFMPLDVMQDGQTEAVFKRIEEEWGEMDFLIHSIAFSPKEALHGRVVDVTREGFAKTMDVSCWSFLRMAKVAVNRTQDIQGYLSAVDAAFSDYLTLIQYRGSNRVEGIRRLGGVDLAVKHDRGERYGLTPQGAESPAG